MKRTLRIHLFIAILMMAAASVCQASDLKYVLDVSIDTNAKRISGTANISSTSLRELSLSVHNLKNVIIDGRKAPESFGGSIVVEVGGKNGPATIQYEAEFNETPAGLIDTTHVFLMTDWYPVPEEPVHYTLSATLPRDFTAVSEAERVTTAFSEELATHLFHFPHPLDALHLAASSHYETKKDTLGNIAIEAFFFREDSALADRYIDSAKKYLAYYETILGPYPYKRFAIIENIRPTGYSMPTFTLLGRDVVRLPFITDTSLPHEIVHQWFGNHVYIDDRHGNWAEGLTTYLADHLLEEKKNGGEIYRKQILMNHAAYVNTGNAMPVSHFRYRMNKAQAVIGYGRSAMFFHGLETRLGSELFFKALNGFIEDHRFRQASWLDIQNTFETITGERLHAYFDTWLNRADIPRLTVEKSRIDIQNGLPALKFSLKQQGNPFPLDIPVQIHTPTCIKKKTVHMTGPQQDFSIELENLPTKVVLDETYDLMRHLVVTEKPPILAGVMGRQKLVLVVSDEMKPVYEPLIGALGVDNIEVATPESLSFSSVKNNTLIVCGHDNPLAKSRLGNPPDPGAGLNLTVFKHPYNDDELILLAHTENRPETLAVKHKLRHYGKYSRLIFQQGRIADKGIAKAENGIPVIEHEEVLALQPGNVPTLAQIKDKLLETQVVFVGENHDQYAHHINQLDIIRHISDSGAYVAVGMEMFHQPYQHIVDAYIANRIDERTFLKQSHYYEEWRYDYWLYKPIVDFCKENKIPLIALNIPGEISGRVAREGIDGLDDEDRTQLPESLDFSNRQYRDYLKTVFGHHGNQNDIDDFNHFFQAQVVWDESMAEQANRFLIKNPAYKLVILAGNGHIRYGHGIPARLFRRSQTPQTIIVQDESLEKKIADYVLLTTKIKGERSPKLGIAVEQQENGLVITGVSKKSPAEKAGLAKGDIIREFDGQNIANLTDLKIALFYSQKDRTYPMIIGRGDQTLEMAITPFEFSHFSMHLKK